MLIWSAYSVTSRNSKLFDVQWLPERSWRYLRPDNLPFRPSCHSLHTLPSSFSGRSTAITHSLERCTSVKAAFKSRVSELQTNVAGAFISPGTGNAFKQATVGLSMPGALAHGPFTRSTTSTANPATIAFITSGMLPTGRIARIEQTSAIGWSASNAGKPASELTAS